MPGGLNTTPPSNQCQSGIHIALQYVPEAIQSRNNRAASGKFESVLRRLGFGPYMRNYPYIKTATELVRLSQELRL